MFMLNQIAEGEDWISVEAPIGISGGIYIEWYLDGVYQDTTYPQDGYGAEYTFRWLSAGMTYWGQALVYLPNFPDPVDSSNPTPIFTLDLPIQRPDNWVWAPPIVAGNPIDISASLWNAFCDRINEFRLWKNMSAFPFTSVHSSDPITALTVNVARQAIGSLLGSMATLPEMAISDTTLVSAAYFNQLRDALNSAN
jgi:hypothetical protein